MPETQSVLVVDDTPENLALVSALLQPHYRVKVANSGERALKIVQAPSKPDLILLDVMMPDLDGYEVCRRLKADPQTRDIPVIFLTAKSQVCDEQLGLELGAVDYISKPISPPILEARVRTQLLLKAQSDAIRRHTQDLEKDLQLAFQLQSSMLPPPELSHPPLQFSALLQPAKTLGGDLYDVRALPDGRWLFCLGDVSDKGVMAALFMVRVLTLLRWLAPQCPCPSSLLGQLNRALHQDNEASMFVTLACGLIEPSSGKFEVACAGQDPPLLLGRGATQALEVESGVALGLFPEAHFPSLQERLLPGEALLLASDGLEEAHSPQGEEFGRQRLLDCLAGVLPSQTLLACQQALSDFCGEAEPHDDLTLLLLQRVGGGSST